MGEDMPGCIDVLENYCIKYGIRGRNSWSKNFHLPYGKLESEIEDEIKEDIGRAEEARINVMKLLQELI